MIIAFQNKLTGGCRRDEQVEVQLPLIRHFRPFGQKISMNHQPITHAHVYMDNSIARVSTPAKIGQLRTSATLELGSGIAISPLRPTYYYGVCFTTILWSC